MVAPAEERRMSDKCFACEKPLRDPKPAWADTRDDQMVLVGPDCKRKILRAGEAGYQPPLGGPKLYPMPSDSCPCSKHNGPDCPCEAMEREEKIRERGRVS